MTFNSFIIQTVWLTQDQMKTLFQRDKSVISRHIRDIFNEGELDPEVVVAKKATTTRHGAIADKTQTHEKLVYNLDVIISVGYRVKSKRGTQFRIWATPFSKNTSSKATRFEVGISVGKVYANLVAGEMLLGGFVQAVGQPVVLRDEPL